MGITVYPSPDATEATEASILTTLADGSQIAQLHSGIQGTSGTLPITGISVDANTNAADVWVRNDVGSPVPVSLGSTTVNVNSELPTASALSGTIAKTISAPVVGAATMVSDGTNLIEVTGDAANGMDVDVTRVSGTVTVSGPLTDTQLRASAVPVSGPLTDTQLRASAVPVSGPITDTQIRATPLPVNGTVATTSAAASQADGHSATIGTTTDTSAANTLVGLLKKLVSLLPTALVGGRLDANIGAWLGATTPTVGQKTMAASIPVTLASDQPVTNINNTAAVPGGATTATVISAASTNASSIKGSAAKLCGYACFNNTATNYYVKLYDVSGTPTPASQSAKITIMVPAGGGANLDSTNGLDFPTGLGIAIVAGMDVNNNTAAAVGVVANIWYK